MEKADVPTATARTNIRIAIFIIKFPPSICSSELLSLQNLPRKLTIDYMRNWNALQQFRNYAVSGIYPNEHCPCTDFHIVDHPPQVKSRKEHKFMDLAGLLQICFVPTLAASLISLKLNAVSFWNPAIKS